MSEIIIGVIAGAKLGVFTILFAYTYLLTRSTDLQAAPLLLLAGAFFVMVLGELVYIAGQGSSVAIPWLTNFENLQFFADVLEIGAVVGAGLFLRSLRSQLEG